MPNPFWKGKATVMLHKDTFKPQAADGQTPAASSGWATAAQRHRETPSQPTNTAGFAFQPSDYLPAEQVCAAAPKAPDMSTILVRRPCRPKVEVSASLKLLLQSSADLHQQHQHQLACTPTTQPAVSQLLSHKSAGATPLGQIVLKKRYQFTPSAQTVPKLAQGQQSKQPAVAQSGSAQVPGSAAVSRAVQGLKRPAVPVPTGTRVAPALLKRPKLAGHAKPPTSRAAAGQAKGTAVASKGQAVGKLAAAEKAVSKATIKVPGTCSVSTNGTIQHAVAMSAAQAKLGDFSAAANSGAAKTLGVSPAAPVASIATSPEAARAPATAAAIKAPRQRKKAEDIDLAEVEKKMHEKQAAGRMQDVSIPELKCFLKARKLPVGGKKSDLLARVEPLLVKA